MQQNPFVSGASRMKTSLISICIIITGTTENCIFSDTLCSLVTEYEWLWSKCRRDNRRQTWATDVSSFKFLASISFLAWDARRQCAINYCEDGRRTRVGQNATATNRPAVWLTPPARNEKIISHILRFIGCQVIGGNRRLTKEQGLHGGTVDASQSSINSVTNLFSRQHTRRTGGGKESWQQVNVIAAATQHRATECTWDKAAWTPAGRGALMMTMTP